MSRTTTLVSTRKLLLLLTSVFCATGAALPTSDFDSDATTQAGQTANTLAKRTGHGQDRPIQPHAGPSQPPAQPQAGQAQAQATFDLATVTATSPTVLRGLTNLGFDMFDQIMFASSGNEVRRIIAEQDLGEFSDFKQIEKDWQSDGRRGMLSTSTSANNHWSHGPRSAEECDITPIVSSLQAFGIATSFPPCACYVWLQDKDFKVVVTMALEKFAYNIVDNAIVILSSESPLSILEQKRQNHEPVPERVYKSRTITRPRIPNELPAPGLNVISDIIDRTIRIVHEKTPKYGAMKANTVLKSLAGLKTIVYQSLHGPVQTLETIKAVIGNSGQLKYWPGVQFDIGSAAFDALIATSTFRDVAWYVAQRKKTFGDTPITATRVHVFRGQGDGANTPSVLWELGDVNPELVAAAKARHEQWTRSLPASDTPDASSGSRSPAPYPPPRPFTGYLAKVAENARLMEVARMGEERPGTGQGTGDPAFAPVSVEGLAPPPYTGRRLKGTGDDDLPVQQSMRSSKACGPASLVGSIRAQATVICQANKAQTSRARDRND